jgi:hypothetical protein
MTRLTIAFSFLFIGTVLILFPTFASSAEILGPAIEMRGNNIFVKTGLTEVKEIETTINSGIEKEIVFTIELFRAWRFWPDEFVVSKKIHRIIRYDDLRGQYQASSDDGDSRSERNFKEFNYQMKKWFFLVNKINLVNIKELDPGNYYVRVVAESKSKEIPTVIGILMLFIPEVEMSLAKESHDRLRVGKSE